MRYRKTKIVAALLIIIAGIALFPESSSSPVQYIDRSSGELKIEKIAGERWLNWLYNNPVGEASLHLLVRRKIVSELYGTLMDEPGSVEKIEPFIADFNIDTGIIFKSSFSSFNDFFTRKLKKDARPVDTSFNVLISPADGKCLGYEDISASDFIIKGYRFDVYSFLNDSALARQYDDGSLIVIRLAPPDYHRFHFPVSGRVSKRVKIEGDYFSVNPIALRKMAKLFCLNKREYTLISSEQFGDVIMVEVGATMVGSIIQTYQHTTIKKGDEKGYFKFGGSTVVLLLKKNAARIDSDILENTSNGFETFVKTGERIAIKCS